MNLIPSLFRKKRLPVLMKKRAVNTYSLLLREKKRRFLKPDFQHPENRSFPYYWMKYRSYLWGILLGIAVFIILGVIFFFSNLFSVDEIALTRRDFRVNVEGVSSLLLPYRGENIFFISKKEIGEKIFKKYPEIKSIEVIKSYPRKLEVIVETHPIIVKWEFRFPSTIPEGPSSTDPPPLTNIIVYLNALGKVSMTEPADEEKAFHIIERDDDFSEELYFGFEVYPKERIEEILRGKEYLETITPYTILAAELFRDAQEIHYYSKDGPEFWVDFFTPFDEQIRKIELALNETDLFEESMLYLDLRISGKLIYMPK